MKILFIFFITLCFFENIKAKVDISNLATAADVKSVKPAEESSKMHPQRDTKKTIARGEIKSEEVSKLRESLKGVNLILNNQPQSPNRTDLLLKKSYLHLNIARELGRNRKSVTEMSEEERKHLNTAKDVLNKLLQPDIKISSQKKASVNYLLGLVAFEFEDYKLQQKYFIESLQIDPKSQQAGSLSLMIAEQYFDDEDFVNALKYYNNFTNYMTENQKDLSVYKSAWSYISLQKYPEAEKELLKIINSKKVTDFQKDSLRDLAFISTRYRTEDSILEFGGSSISQLNFRNEYFKLCLKYYFQMQTKQTYNKLIVKVLETETNINDRLEIKLHQVRDTRVNPNNIEVIKLYQEVRMELEKSKKKIDDPGLESAKDLLMSDVEFFIFNLTQAYQNKTVEKNNVNQFLQKKKISQLLEKHILYYDYFFPDSKNKITVYQVLLDLCIEAKSLACVNQVYDKSNKVKKEDLSWNEFRKKIRVEQLILVDELYTKNPTENEKLFLSTLDKFKNEYPQHELALRALKKSLNIFIKNNDQDQVLQLYKEIYEKEKNEDNLYNLSITLFKLEKYDEILKLIDGQYLASVKINQLRSEIHLKLASSNASLNTDTLDFNSIKLYEAHIVEVLKLNKDNNKAVTIYIDWLNKAFKLKTGSFEYAYEIFKKIPIDIKKDPLFSSFAIKFSNQFLLNGDFNKISEIDFNYSLVKSEKESEQNLNYFKVIQKINLGEVKDLTYLLDNLSMLQRQYIVGLLILIKPDLAIQFLKNTKVKEEKNAELYLLALKMKNKNEYFNISNEDKKILGSLSKRVEKKVIVEPTLIKELKSIKFPTSDMNLKKYNAATEKLVAEVKKMRLKTIKILKNSQIEQQLMILPLAEEVENKTAQSLEKAPAPIGLDADQEKEYKAGIAELAKEFSEQAKEFNKLKVALAEKNSEIISEINNAKLPEIDLTQWPWPKNAIIEKAIQLQTQSDFNAHLYLDRNFSEKKINEDDYYKTRVGLLMISQNTEVMRSYLKQELEDLKKNDIIQIWKSIKDNSGKQPGKSSN